MTVAAAARHRPRQQGRDLPLEPWAIGVGAFVLLTALLLVTLPSARTAERAPRPTAPVTRVRHPAPPSAARGDGRHVRPRPPRPPGRRQRGRRPVRPRRGRLRPHRPAVAEGGRRRLHRRAPLPDDRHRHRVQPALHREPGRLDRPGPTYTIDTLRDLRAAARRRRRAVLHHRRRRARPDPDLEGRRRALRRSRTSSASPARATTCPTTGCRRHG